MVSSSIPTSIAKRTLYSPGLSKRNRLVRAYEKDTAFVDRSGLGAPEGEPPKMGPLLVTGPDGNSCVRSTQPLPDVIEKDQWLKNRHPHTPRCLSPNKTQVSIRSAAGENYLQRDLRANLEPVGAGGRAQFHVEIGGVLFGRFNRRQHPHCIAGDI